MEAFANELQSYALQKLGAELDGRGAVKIPGCVWGTFFEISCEFADLPVATTDVSRLLEEVHGAKKSSMLDRDGHSYILLPIDDQYKETIYDCIDKAYEIVWSKVSDEFRYLISLAKENLADSILLEKLIDYYKLQEQQTMISQLVKKAFLLRTSTEEQHIVGQSRIGGCPDLPSDVQWPTFEDKPLAFLGQFNLKEMPPNIVEGLPVTGLLCCFSAWGWQEYEGGYPDHPDKGYNTQAGWNILWHFPENSTLNKREIPNGVNGFSGLSIQPEIILSLPNNIRDPHLSKYNLSENTLETFDRMQSSLRRLQMSRYFGFLEVGYSHHLLGGYPLFQQEFPEQLQDGSRELLWQLGSDDGNSMYWADDGDIAFYVDVEDLKKGKFSSVWAECQCG
ncbi:YwqG family protein [Candidatus Uabimicrobium amorphum]|uniref:DUF1963 domain-containing protein n=2 Tax=Uabimicrobium amorphum TaxID=2596890 RepID=A0A5S9ISZ3_UABAM|nr:hypothetical protein UABAM_05580 [Candidatus Uabimicrobium amorphum]